MLWIEMIEKLGHQMATNIALYPGAVVVGQPPQLHTQGAGHLSQTQSQPSAVEDAPLVMVFAMCSAYWQLHIVQQMQQGAFPAAAAHHYVLPSVLSSA
jgi:hypothetical protein